MRNPIIQKLVAITAAASILFFPLPPAYVYSASSATRHTHVISGDIMVTGVAAALARADDAMARSMLPPGLANPMKGEAAERMAAYEFRGRLRETGRWMTLRSRFGRTGIDDLLVRFDTGGRPRQLMVVEYKYGSSQLGETVDGRQMSRSWIARRLNALADRTRHLIVALDRGEIELIPRSGRQNIHLLPIPFKGGRIAYFWRENSVSAWKLDLNGATSGQVGEQARELARLQEASASGRVDFRSRVVQMTMKRESITYVVRDASSLDFGKITMRDLPILRQQVVPIDVSTLSRMRGESSREIAAALKSRLPHITGDDADELGKGIARRFTMLDDMHGVTPELWLSSFGGAVRGGLVGVALDPMLRIAAGERDMSRLARGAIASGSAVFAGVLVAQRVTATMLSNSAAYGISRDISQSVGIRSTVGFARGAGAFSGMAVTAIALPLAEYWLGLTNSTDASRNMVEGLAGVGAAAGLSAATFSLISAYGAASTGTAIASLSGVAATNATFAWIGGGSIATGGFGMTGGALIATTGVGIILIAVPAVVMIGFHCYDDKQEAARIQLTLKALSKRDHFHIAHTDRIEGFTQSATK